MGSAAGSGSHSIRRLRLIVVVSLVSLLAMPSPAHADIVRGLMRIIGGVLEIPRSALVGTFTGPPILGTVGGVLVGAVNGIGMVASGALETIVSAIPLAAKAAPWIPVFL